MGVIFMNEPDLPPEEISRRKLLSRIGIFAGVVGAVMVGAPVVGFLFSPLIRKPALVWRDVGKADGFKVGETVAVNYQNPSPESWAGITANSAAYLRRLSQTEFVAFSVNCTHLGCPVRWLPESGLFMCPCHGGVYDSQGNVVAGPPPKPLFHYPVRVENGQVQILTSPIPIG
jgi:menaquinol-cytochrome c reductase iron-sulfur subunit